MITFRECALFVLREIGMDQMPSEGYLDDLERLNEAAYEWHRQPEAQGLEPLHFDIPDVLDTDVFVTGNLDAAITAGWACNDAAKAFVRYIDERTGKCGTLFMLQILLLIQEAVQENKRIQAAGGDVRTGKLFILPSLQEAVRRVNARGGSS